MDFYNNILQIGAYYIVNFDTSISFDKFLLKNSIDTTNIIKFILNNNNYNNEEVKFYLYPFSKYIFKNFK